ncbi:MAG: PspC domain-containing protein [Anaerolineales bacterium]|jgi:phage shock protein PspC (stress-responsive transcriptional regulator)
MEKHLYRSRRNRILGGVCGGIAEYFGLDPTLVRIITVLLMLLPGIGVLTYVILWIVIPARPIGEEIEEPAKPLSSTNKYLPGIILIAFGLLLLFREYVFHFTWSDFWPLVLIVLGIALIIAGNARSSEQHSSEIHSQHINGHNGGDDR